MPEPLLFKTGDKTIRSMLVVATKAESLPLDGVLQGGHTHGPREDWEEAQKALVWRAVSLTGVKSVADAAQIARVPALVKSSGAYTQWEICKHERDAHITEEVNSAPANLIPQFHPMTSNCGPVCSLRTLTSSRSCREVLFNFCCARKPIVPRSSVE